MTAPAPPLTGAAGLPVAESLLAPLLDVAARTLVRLDDATLPPVLRPLAGFDRRGLQSTTARQQLRRALEVDAGFRDRVVERFLDLPEVRAELDRWDPASALVHAEETAERDDLAWLASALCAARPDGWAFGLGVVCALAARERTEREHEDDVRARETHIESLDEARRRAEEAVAAAEARIATLEGELRDERRSRRARERRGEQEVELATRRLAEAEAVAARTEQDRAKLEARLQREKGRVREIEGSLREVQRALDEVDAARALEVPPASERAPAPVPVVAAGPPVVAERSARRGDGRRMSVKCPPGLTADDPDALDAMLRTRGVVLVVDGYNVSMAGWASATAADQRARLVAALERLHLRLRCDAVVVFDGADVESQPPARRRSGVRVRFSPAGEEADPVVVREVSEHPATTPVVVASSDRWVRDHAEAEGATAVHAATLLALLRR